VSWINLAYPKCCESQSQPNWNLDHLETFVFLVEQLSQAPYLWLAAAIISISFSSTAARSNFHYYIYTATIEYKGTLWRGLAPWNGNIDGPKKKDISLQQLAGLLGRVQSELSHVPYDFPKLLLERTIRNNNVSSIIHLQPQSASSTAELLAVLIIAQPVPPVSHYRVQ